MNGNFRNGAGLGFLREAVNGLIEANAGQVYEWEFEVDGVKSSIGFEFMDGSGMVWAKYDNEIVAWKNIATPGFGFDNTKDRVLASKIYNAFVKKYDGLSVEFEPYVTDEGKVNGGIYVQKGEIHIWAKGEYQGKYREIDRVVLKQFSGRFGFGDFWQLLRDAAALRQSFGFGFSW